MPAKALGEVHTKEKKKEKISKAEKNKDLPDFAWQTSVDILYIHWSLMHPSSTVYFQLQK